MKDNVTTTKLTIPSEFGYERIAALATSAIAQFIGLPHKRVKDLEVAISEACINAFEHGYQNQEGYEVVITITVSDSALTVEVRDFGVGGVSLDEKSERNPGSRGWGLHLIRKLVDDVTVESVQGEGTRIHMAIYRHDNETKGGKDA